ncbi:M48 family metallopeptidase [Pontiellaceae bacterium B1224]|nr:M48 family metallopeptidase [Pontiellaceae bacterium B1224]
MKKTGAVIAVYLLALSGSVYAEIIQVGNVSVRTRPGAFYPAIEVLSSGDEVSVLASEQPWKKVKTPTDTIGWISKNAFNAADHAIDYGAMAQDNPERNLSKIMVTAAAKGFFERQMKNAGLNQDVLQNPVCSYIVPASYNRFLSETYEGRWSRNKFARKHKLPSKAGSFQIDDEMVALSSYICARMAAPGLSDDTAMVLYVNNVAQLVMESTEFYDLPISVHVVKSNNIFANSTPIGAIMISEGMLGIIETESELACLIGHEIAHVTRNHAATEFEILQPKFAAEKAFMELEQEFGVSETEMELEELSNQMYERAIHGRKDQYESEADQWGALYAMRAGYNPEGMCSLLQRLQTRISVSQDPGDASHWLPRSMEQRIAALNHYLNKEYKPSAEYRSFQERYRKNVRGLQKKSPSSSMEDCSP